MTTITTRQTNTFPEAKIKFLAKAERLVQGYDKMPCEEYSSERMGGWLIKDTNDMLIGWVGNLGEITVYDYKPTTKANANARNFRGVK